MSESLTLNVTYESTDQEQKLYHLQLERQNIFNFSPFLTEIANLIGGDESEYSQEIQGKHINSTPDLHEMQPYINQCSTDHTDIEILVRAIHNSDISPENLKIDPENFDELSPENRYIVSSGGSPDRDFGSQESQEEKIPDKKPQPTLSNLLGGVGTVTKKLHEQEEAEYQQKLKAKKGNIQKILRQKEEDAQTIADLRKKILSLQRKLTVSEGEVKSMEQSHRDAVREMEKEYFQSERLARWERIEKDNKAMKRTLGDKNTALEAQNRIIDEKTSQIVNFDKRYEILQQNLTSQKNLYKELEKKYSAQKSELETKCGDNEFMDKQIFATREEQQDQYIQNMNMISKLENVDHELKTQIHYTDCQDLTIKKLKNDFSAIMDIFSQLLEDTGCLIKFPADVQNQDFLMQINIYSKEIKNKFGILGEQVSVQNEKIENLFLLVELTEAKISEMQKTPKSRSPVRIPKDLEDLDKGVPKIVLARPVVEGYKVDKAYDTGNYTNCVFTCHWHLHDKEKTRFSKGFFRINKLGQTICDGCFESQKKKVPEGVVLKQNKLKKL